MGRYYVNTHEYGVDIKKLIKRRLVQAGSKLSLECEGESVYAEIDSEKEFEKWCNALSRLLLHDAAPFELAKMVNDLPLELSEREDILTEAVRLSHNVLGYNFIRHMLREYFAENDSLNIEGFIFFRMSDIKSRWESCVDEAIKTLALRNEYLEMMSVWATFAKMSPSHHSEVNVILHPDGSCTLTDEYDSRIDCERCTFDGIVSVLVGLSPEHITVYDMSAGESKGVAELLSRVFEDRVSFLK